MKRIITIFLIIFASILFSECKTNNVVKSSFKNTMIIDKDSTIIEKEIKPIEIDTMWKIKHHLPDTVITVIIK